MLFIRIYSLLIECFYIFRSRKERTPSKNKQQMETSEQLTIQEDDLVSTKHKESQYVIMDIYLYKIFLKHNIDNKLSFTYISL